jgi:hypothetical protein
MGITPDVSYHAGKRSFRSVGLAVVAAIRMGRLAEEWKAQKKIHAQLVQKLEAMRRRRSGKIAGTR